MIAILPAEVSGSFVDKDIQRLSSSLSTVELWRFLDRFVGPYLQDKVDARFRREGAEPGYSKWQPLAEGTIWIRKKTGFPPGPINVRTGHLRDWVRTYAASGDMLQMPATDAPTAEMASKFKVAQLGGHGTHGKGKITGNPAPPRPVLRFSVQNREVIKRNLAKWVANGGKGRAYYPR